MTETLILTALTVAAIVLFETIDTHSRRNQP